MPVKQVSDDLVGALSKGNENVFLK
jgi:hypothetical protein